MLKKLMKYDLRSIFRFTLPMYAIIAVLGVLSCGAFVGIYAMLESSEYSTSVGIVLISVVFAFFALFMMAVISVVAAAFMPFVHFYRHLFSDEGYLTLTLPAKMSDHLLSKTVTVFISGILSIVAFGIYILLTFYLPGFFIESAKGNFQYAIDLLQVLFSNTLTGELAFFDYLLSVLNFLASAFSSTVLGFMAITLGAVVFKNHKIIGAVLFYFLISMLNNIVSLFLSAIVTGVASSLAENATFEALSLVNSLSTLISYLGVGIGGYCINLYLFNKKLNLE